MPVNLTPYGHQDTSFQTAGGVEGIRALVDDFYDEMQSQPFAQSIFAMHPKDNATSRDKLTRFLCGWMGGENLYREKYGAINIPRDHSHLAIGEAERDAWLRCMKNALIKQNYPEDFKAYLLQQLAMPAERIRAVSQARIQNGAS